MFYCVVFLLCYKPVFAIVDPLKSPNNVYGIHIIDESDLEDAAKLVNSNGGEWGYVTIVIRKDDRDKAKWQNIFDKMRELKLTPLVRLATQGKGDVWEKPDSEDVDNWVDFLDSLNWVVKNRYIILFNEPNHAQEWGGGINPGEYAKIVRLFHDKLKGKSDDFFILPAGFDAAAPDSPSTMEISNYFARMYSTDRKVFTLFDGWSSHSYPNPGFQGLPTGEGKGSIQSYKWEVNFLEQYGLKSNIPIFITETGWVHKEAENANKKVLGYSSEAVGDFLKEAYQKAWADPRVVAITPFVLNYPAPPFDNFSWKSSTEYYPQFTTVQSLPKKAGSPEQINKNEFLLSTIPDQLVTGSYYSFTIDFKNTGQSIWETEAGFGLGAGGPVQKDNVIVDKISGIKPAQAGRIRINFETTDEVGDKKLTLSLQKNGVDFGDSFAKEIKLVPPPILKIKARILFKSEDRYGFKLQIEGREGPVDEFDDLKLDEEGRLNLPLINVVPGNKYKLSFGKPPYLTSIKEINLNEKGAEVDFGTFIPVDFNSNSVLDFGDLKELLVHPFVQ